MTEFRVHCHVQTTKSLNLDGGLMFDRVRVDFKEICWLLGGFVLGRSGSVVVFTGLAGSDRTVGLSDGGVAVETESGWTGVVAEELFSDC